MRTRSLALVLLAPALACQASDPVDDAGTEAARKVIGPEGGTISSLDDTLRIDIPAGALSSSVEVSITVSFTLSPTIGDKAYRVQPNMPLAVPALLSYDYSNTDVSDYPPEQLVIGRAEQTSFDPIENTSVDTTAMIARGEDIELSYAYGLVLGGPPSDTDATSTTDGSTTEDISTTSSPTTTADTGSSSSSTGVETTGTDTDVSTDTSSESTGSETGNGQCSDGVVDAGEMCLVEGTSVVVGFAPRSIALSDLNGDTFVDLVVANGGADTVSVRLGNGAGDFGLDAPYVVGNNPIDVQIAELTDDTNPDLLVVNETAGSVSVLVGSGGGSFDAAVAFDVGGLPRGGYLADIDEDTLLDLAVVNNGTDDVTLLFGDGIGFIVGDTLPIGNAPVAVAVGDFTNDTNVDLATVAGTDLILNGGNGAGLFGGPAAFDLGALGSALAIADFDDDGNLDAVVAFEATDTILYAPGNGFGGFGLAVPYLVGDAPETVSPADIDGDGSLDVIVITADAMVSVLVGNGGGSFAAPVSFAVGNAPSDFAVADVNDDNAPDVLVTAQADDLVTVYLSDP